MHGSYLTFIFLFQIIFAALLALAVAAPQPVPKAKPGLVYAAPSVYSYAVAPSAYAYHSYSAPVAYYGGYSPYYASPYVAVV